MRILLILLILSFCVYTNCVREYKIAVKTRDKLLSGSINSIFITVKGSQGIIKKAELKKKGLLTFTKGRLDKFTIKNNDIGQVCSITLEKGGLLGSWFPMYVVIVGPKQRQVKIKVEKEVKAKKPVAIDVEGIWESWGEWSKCPASCLGYRQRERNCTNVDCPTNNCDGGKTEIEKCSKTCVTGGTTTKPLTHGSTSKNYKISIKTRNKPNSGTVNNIFITVTGVNGSIPKTILKKKSPKFFTSGRLDKFTIKNDDIGQVCSVKLAKGGTKGSWFPMYVAISGQSIQTEKKIKFEKQVKAKKPVTINVGSYWGEWGEWAKCRANCQGYTGRSRQCKYVDGCKPVKCVGQPSVKEKCSPSNCKMTTKSPGKSTKPGKRTTKLPGKSTKPRKRTTKSPGKSTKPRKRTTKSPGKSTKPLLVGKIPESPGKSRRKGSSKITSQPVEDVSTRFPAAEESEGPTTEWRGSNSREGTPMPSGGTRVYPKFEIYSIFVFASVIIIQTML